MRELKQDWRDIFQGFRIALDPKKMLLGLVWGFLTIFILGVVILQFSSPVNSPLADGFLAAVKHPVTQGGELCTGVCQWLAGDVDWSKTAILGAISGLLSLGLWTYFGGAITRLCAVQFAKDDTLAFRDATEFAWQKKWYFFWSPLVPLIIVAIMALCLWLGGLIGRIPWIGPVGVGLGWGLALFAGCCMTLTLIGGVFGFGLMAPTIAMEGTDTFDAISRAFSYVYQRPWRFIWYNLVALVYGVICTAFVAAAAWLTVMLTVWVSGAGMGENFDAAKGFLMEWRLDRGTAFFPAFAAFCIKAWVVLVGGLVLGFGVSYYCASQTIVYALLRKDVDGTDVTEVYVEDEEEDLTVPPAIEEEPEGAEADSGEYEEADASDEYEPDEVAATETKKAKKKAKRKSRKKATRKRKKKTAE